MDSSIMTRIIIPLAIAFIMFGMGLCLTPHDFKRILCHPKAILTGILLQIVGLPVLGFVFVRVAGLDSVPATSVMILSACPGGAITNLVSFIAEQTIT
ncbi:MAG: hypothetical protein HUK40_05200 [Desulfobacter sp.]|nr:hypothetical protein [Desulfobacter sp.]WDP87452.1 MAG: hypothetical protein HUN05_21885 [Desulfobacter sp.]